MKIPVWVVVMGGSHDPVIRGGSPDPVVTVHSTKAEGRAMIEHALKHEGVARWDHPENGTVVDLPDLPLATLKEAWEYHNDGPCLIEKHEVDIPLTELGEIIAAFKNIVAEVRGERDYTILQKAAE